MPVRFRLADAIEKAKTNQSALARESGVSIVTINAMAKNRTKQVQLLTLDKLSDALRCDPGDLIERVPDETKAKKGKGKR